MTFAGVGAPIKELYDLNLPAYRALATAVDPRRRTRHPFRAWARDQDRRPAPALVMTVEALLHRC